MPYSTSIIMLIASLFFIATLVCIIHFKRMHLSLKILSVVIIVIVIATPFYAYYSFMNGNPYTKLLTKLYIPNALEQHGYSEEDFQRMDYSETKHTINNDYYHGHYVIIFKDEPHVAYYYGLKKRGKDVVQFCEQERVHERGIIGGEIVGVKHHDEACAGIYDNRD